MSIVSICSGMHNILYVSVSTFATYTTFMMVRDIKNHAVYHDCYKKQIKSSQTPRTEHCIKYLNIRILFFLKIAW